MCLSNTYIAGIILAGGQGQRMGGADKGLQTHADKPLIEHVIAALEPQTNELLISANRNIKDYQRYGYTVQRDEHESGYQGPMAGINACVKLLSQVCDAEYALVSSCDTPSLPNDLASRLLDDLRTSGEPVAVVHDGNRTQNLHCLIQRAAWPSLQRFYANGGRAMYQWYQQVGVVHVDFSAQENAFRNLNLTEHLDQQDA